LLDVSRINALGWKAKVSLKDGLEKAIEWYKKNRTQQIK
jgi:GDP-L-fucose synthase